MWFPFPKHKYFFHVNAQVTISKHVNRHMYSYKELFGEGKIIGVEA